jgi:hypothetical protein
VTILCLWPSFRGRINLFIITMSKTFRKKNLFFWPFKFCQIRIFEILTRSTVQIINFLIRHFSIFFRIRSDIFSILSNLDNNFVTVYHIVPQHVTVCPKVTVWNIFKLETVGEIVDPRPSASALLTGRRNKIVQRNSVHLENLLLAPIQIGR